MNRWWILTFAFFFLATIPAIFFGNVYGWHTLIKEMPIEVIIIDAVSFVVGCIGFLLSLIIAITRERFPK